MISKAARCETLHLDPAQRPALVDSDLPLPIISGLAMADDGSIDMAGAHWQQALACDVATTRQHCWTAKKPVPYTNQSPLASPATKHVRRCPITSCSGILQPTPPGRRCRMNTLGSIWL